MTAIVASLLVVLELEQRAAHRDLPETRGNLQVVADERFEGGVPVC
jgi:hypothetical protein